MTWGTVTLGPLSFRETITASESSGKLTISGQESTPPQTADVVHAAHLNIIGLRGTVIPATFTDKAELNGFYLVTDAQADLLNHANGSVLACTWQIGLSRVGTSRDLEFESRLPLVARSTELAGPPAAVFWHAPPVGFADYYTGATVPAGSLVRQSGDGPVTVYTGVPTATYPRWTCDVSAYMGGSARVLLDTIQRVGPDTPAHSAWEVNNGIVQVTGGRGGPAFSVAAWTGLSWLSVKGYVPTVNGTAVTAAPEFTIIRNDPEQVAVRLFYPSSPGRLTVDLMVRRGARLVTGVIKRQAAAGLGVSRTAAEAATVVTGGLKATTADTDGHKFVMGSSRTLATTTATASISKASVTQLDFFLGHEFGPSVQPGDAFSDLLGLFLGTAGEQTRPVRR